MGFVDKLRGELIDIVEWVDDSRHTLVWRFPRYHNQIKNGAQLIVRPGQTALFVHKGKIADVFEPGTHRLTTDNLPVLSTLQGWKHGFRSPFKAEVYFTATRQITDLKWGTPNPVIMRDPDFGPIRIRAFGTFTLKPENPKALVSELVGTDSEFEAEEISVLLRSVINTCFADMVANSGISVMDLASNYQELSGQLRAMAAERVDDEFGLSIPQLYIVNISLPEEVEKAIDSRASMGVIGDLDRYQRYQLGASMPVAAENPAGGLAGAGVGLGMGMAYAQNMGAPGGAAGATMTAPVPPAVPGTMWHIVEQGRSVGPFTQDQLARAVGAGRITPDTLVWSAGMPAWNAASRIPAIAGLFGQTPPPVP